MPPQTPLLLVDNVFDSVIQYPTAIISGSSERAGHEGHRVADYRRERTSYQPVLAAANRYVYADLGAGVTRAPDSLYIDRGHNLWGKTIQVAGDDGVGGSPVSINRTVPAAGTLGGDPTGASCCVTEEGALYCLFGALGARQRWFVYVIDNMLPVITGLILGVRTQLVSYSRVFDEDAGERTEDFATSKMGVRGYDTTYGVRTLKLDLTYIGPQEYDTTTRMLREKLWRGNSPFVCVMDWGTRPERGWMYQYDGKGWGFPKSRVYRAGAIQAREVGVSVP